MEAHSSKAKTSQSNHELLSSSRVPYKIKPGTIKVSFLRRSRSRENKSVPSLRYSSRKHPVILSTVQLTTDDKCSENKKDFHPVKHNSANISTRQYHPRVQPLASRSFVEWSKSTSTQSTTNAWENGDLNDNKKKTIKLTKKHHEHIHELSLLSPQSCLSKADHHQNISSKMAWSSDSQIDIFSTSGFKESSANLEYGQSLEHKKKERKYCSGDHCCCCSLLGASCALICGILIAAVIAAITLGILLKPKTTTAVFSSTSTVTTSTSTTATTSTTTTTASTSTSTSTSTTTTPYICNTSCVNQTWQSSLNLQAKWLFDETFSDEMNNYNATQLNNVSFITNGYVQEAVAFILNANQMLTAPYIPLANTSFTIETWLYITVLLNIQDQSIFGICPVIVMYQCLHLTIRQISSNYFLYFGFFNADCHGTTPLTLNTWIHAAFVFDMAAMKQSVYLNGVLQNSCSVSSALIFTPSNVTIGYIPGLALISAHNYFQGYIDQLTVSARAKLSCEILEDATLSAYFTFDNRSLVIDSGPNSLAATTQSTFTASSGYFSQAITFAGSTSSYFQVNDLTTLGISNRSFSISLWIRPVSLSGVLVHVSSNASGLGWCLPFIGFATNGSIVAQISNSNGIISVMGPSVPFPTSTWSHIVQTWSSTNGLRLYVNNILVASQLSLATTYTASTMSNYVTLGNSLNGGLCGQGQMGTLAPYQGDMDDFRIYSRELSAADVCNLYIA